MFAQTGDTSFKNPAPTDANVSSVFEEKQQPAKCRDPLFAVLFYINLGVIIAIASIFGVSPFVDPDENAQDAGENGDTINFSPFIYTIGLCGGIGLVMSCLAVNVLMCIPGILIKVALIGNLVLTLGFAVIAVMYGSIAVAILCFIGFALCACYTFCIWSRIPFATANLKTGTAAIRANCGVTVFAYIDVAIAFGWTILWLVAFLGIQDSIVSCEEVDGAQNGEQVCSGFNYVYLFFLFVSYYFTHQVLQNVLHTTIAGVIGTWWFVPDEVGFCGKAVCGSLYRTLTTSFGSVCFGSLIVAIIEAIRQLIETARSNDEIGGALVCCIDCILGCIQGLVEYFNKWAYVYVGLYGFGYCEAGKSVMQLFRDRGWEALIADDIVSTVLMLVSFVNGIITAGVGMLVAKSTNWFDDVINQIENGDVIVLVTCGIIGFIIGFALCAIIMGVISSAVNATIVLFAEAPAEFETNYPELSQEMRSAYQLAHPGCM